MRTTYPEARFDFSDVTALKDSTLLSSAIQDFVDLGLLQDNIEQSAYGTMELNQFILDGSLNILPEQPEIPFWSSKKSDAECTYSESPTLEISFTEPHSSIGLTLHFAEDIPAEVRIVWYALSGIELADETFYPDSAEYFCECNVQNYGKLVITFQRSSWPYRYVKMDCIEYGGKWLMGRNKIKTASVYEELDITSATLSINTASMEFIDTDGDFELSNKKGLWKSLQEEQDISIVEYVDGEAVECGTFYLDTWDSQKNIVKFSMIDRIGVMDKTMYYGGTIYEGVYAGEIIVDIMASAGVEKYSIEEEIYYTPLSGWIAIQSHRAALQQVVFACGAVADCSRSDWVRIYKPDQYVSHTIGLARKFMGTKITLNKYVSGISVGYVQYTLSADTAQISKSTLPAGTTRIEFTEPYLASSITVSAGTIKTAKTNYVEVTMTEPGECTISGRKYEKIENSYTVRTAVEAGEAESIQSYSGCTLVDAGRAMDIAKHLLSYNQMRQSVEMRFINAGEAVGNWCNVALAGGGEAMTGILSQTLDLTGGNISSAKCRGYELVTVSDYFAGTELYAGEDGII